MLHIVPLSMEKLYFWIRLWSWGWELNPHIAALQAAA